MPVKTEIPSPILTYFGMTVQFCIEMCRALGSSHLSALQVDKCICIEDTIFEMDFARMPESFCNDHCSGNPLQKCGFGNGFLSFYNTSLYDPINHDSCLDYFKVGMVPLGDTCVTLKVGEDTSECCWNSLLRQDKVQKYYW